MNSSAKIRNIPYIIRNRAEKVAMFNEKPSAKPGTKGRWPNSARSGGQVAPLCSKRPNKSATNDRTKSPQTTEKASKDLSGVKCYNIGG